MSVKTNGGPAFPTDYVKHPPLEVGNYVAITEHSPGMTLRDYFAAKALAGWWSSSDSMCALPKGKTLVEFQTEACAKFYEWADAMLAARSDS